MKIQFILSCVTLMGVVAGCAPSQDSALEANKEVVRQFVAAFNSGDFDSFDGLVRRDLVRHSQAAGVKANTLEEFKEHLSQVAEAFPDAREEIDVLIAEADTIVAYGTWSGTQEGPYGPFPATGKKTRVQFFYLFRIEGGQIAELWTEWDNLTMLSQLGHYLPSPKT